MTATRRHLAIENCVVEPSIRLQILGIFSLKKLLLHNVLEVTHIDWKEKFFLCMLKECQISNVKMISMI